MLRKVSLTFLISFFLITPAIADELSSVDEFYQKCKENEIYGAQRLFDVDEAAQIDLPTLTEIINGLATIRGQYLHNPSNAEQSPPKGFKYWSANIHDGYSTVSFDTKKVRLFFSVAFQGVVTPKIFILRAFDSRDKHIELSSERFSVDHSLSAKRGRFWEDPFVEELSRPTQSPTKTNIVPIPLQQQLTGDELAAKLIQSLDYVETLSTINRLLYQYRGFPDDLLIDLPRKYDLWIGRGVRPTHKTVKGNIRANAERLKQILLKKGRPIPPLLEFLSALRLYGEFNSNRPLLPQIIKDQIVPDLNLGKTIWGIQANREKTIHRIAALFLLDEPLFNSIVLEVPFRKLVCGNSPLTSKEFKSAIKQSPKNQVGIAASLFERRRDIEQLIEAIEKLNPNHPVLQSEQLSKYKQYRRSKLEKGFLFPALDSQGKERWFLPQEVAAAWFPLFFPELELYPREFIQKIAFFLRTQTALQAAAETEFGVKRYEEGVDILLAIASQKGIPEDLRRLAVSEIWGLPIQDSRFPAQAKRRIGEFLQSPRTNSEENGATSLPIQIRQAIPLDELLAFAQDKGVSIYFLLQEMLMSEDSDIRKEGEGLLRSVQKYVASLDVNSTDIIEDLFWIRTPEAIALLGKTAQSAEISEDIRTQAKRTLYDLFGDDALLAFCSQPAVRSSFVKNQRNPFFIATALLDPSPEVVLAAIEKKRGLTPFNDFLTPIELQAVVLRSDLAKDPKGEAAILNAFLQITELNVDIAIETLNLLQASDLNSKEILLMKLLFRLGQLRENNHNASKVADQIALQSGRHIEGKPRTYSFADKTALALEHAREMRSFLKRNTTRGLEELRDFERAVSRKSEDTRLIPELDNPLTLSEITIRAIRSRRMGR